MKVSLVRGLIVVAVAAAGFYAHAQPYPAKPVRFVVPFVPGGPTDIQGRMLGEKLSQRLGQQVIIDNRGGAGGNIAAKLVAGAPADGYTLLVNTAAISINASLYQNPGFDISRDFVPCRRSCPTSRAAG